MHRGQDRSIDKKVKIIAGLAAGILLVSVWAQPAEKKLSLKLSVGPSFPAHGADLKDWFASEELYDQWLGGQSGYTAGGQSILAKSRLAGSLGVAYRFRPNIALAFELGFLGKTASEFTSDISQTYGGSLGTDTLQNTVGVAASAMSITVSGIYTIPLGKYRLNLAPGIGYYPGRVEFTERIDYSWPEAPQQANYRYTAETTLKCPAGGFGWHLAAGFEMPLSPRLAVSVDLVFRQASIKNLKGEQDWEETVSSQTGTSTNSGTTAEGTMWFGAFTWEGRSYQRAAFATAAPSWLADARAFRLNLGGLEFKVGVRFDL